MPRITDENGYETEEFICDCGCNQRHPIKYVCEEILEQEGLYVEETHASEYIENSISGDEIARAERFYV